MQPLQYDLRDLAAEDNSIAQHQATFMQPLQCDHCCKTHRRNLKEPNDPSRNRRTDEVAFIAGCSHFTRKKHTVSCSGFLPNTKPMQHHAAIPMRSGTTALQETHRTTHTGTSIVAKHIEGTKRPQPQPPHRRGSFHRRLQPLYTEKHTVSCSGFLPNTKPMQHHAAIPMRSGTTASRNA